ncbi:cellulose binding domain-containing protein [Streptomyces sp. NPDC020983]|uniref:cellulose binding domain-containing protein n=1 Tax=Streptomyces sp. NPDC020983 TaxID=3365106 RepID=UPI0037A93DEC
MPSKRVLRSAAGGSAAALLAAAVALAAAAVPAAHAAGTTPTPAPASATAPPPTSPAPTAPPATIPPTTPTGPVTPTPPPPGSTCAVDYRATQWATGFSARVTLTTTGQANGWLVTWEQPSGPQTVTHAWNATVTTSGTTYAARSLDRNAVIPRGGGTVTFGFTATWSGSNPPPTGFVFNGLPCTSN